MRLLEPVLEFGKVADIKSTHKESVTFSCTRKWLRKSKHETLMSFTIATKVITDLGINSTTTKY